MNVTGRWWPGDNGLCFASTTEIVLPGADALVAMSPLSSHGSLPVTGALMAFKCLTCAHIILVGLVLCWKEDNGEALTHSGGSYWCAVSSGDFGTHQRVILPRIP